MENRYLKVRAELKAFPRRWLVTGAAGFIGSHLVETLLELGQSVTGLDNLSTGSRENLTAVLEAASPGAEGHFTLVEGDIRDLSVCRKACDGVEFVLHQAALGSVPRSIADPAGTFASNVDGFLNMMLASRDAQVKSFVYASSSSVYGDEETLPKVEERIGRPLSPYALSKSVDEQLAEVFARAYGFWSIGLRYFNVFGPRQDPEGPYAAVIPRWFDALATGTRPVIYGDGQTSRDFCYVANAVQANLLAAKAPAGEAWNRAYNVACGSRTSLNELFALVREQVAKTHPEAASLDPAYEAFRPGDIRHSLADITKASTLLGYAPTHSVRDGLSLAASWYLKRDRY